MKPTRIVLLHGAATTGAVWDPVAEILRDAPDAPKVINPDRPSTGDIASEMAWLAPLAKNALVVGVGGGAALCLALAASEVQFAGALAHEPAAGRLVPELYAPLVMAYARGGARALAAAAYGASWDSSMLGNTDSVGRDFLMLRMLEPRPTRDGQGPVLVTVGSLSPPVRHHAADALSTVLGYNVATLPGARHFVQRENPALFAEWILAMLAGLRTGA
jgi:pimeloyl-ACP methyl ester carboxylesterase